MKRIRRLSNLITLFCTFLYVTDASIETRQDRSHNYCKNCSVHKKDAFITPSLSTVTKSIRRQTNFKLMAVSSHKEEFISSLDTTDTLNNATKDRSMLIQRLIDNKLNTPLKAWQSNKKAQSSPTITTTDQGEGCKSLSSPGLVETFDAVAKGNWKVVYAPHMTTIAGLFGGKFDVQYNLHSSLKMESHAKFDFPIIGRGYLSVSGTYGSVDEGTSRVDFDRAWVKLLDSSVMNEYNDNNKEEEEPYQSLSDVPDGPLKDFINTVGKTLFIEQFSVFPISFLDDNLIVFEFPLLGTRVCALKQD